MALWIFRAQHETISPNSKSSKIRKTDNDFWPRASACLNWEWEIRYCHSLRCCYCCCEYAVYSVHYSLFDLIPCRSSVSTMLLSARFRLFTVHPDDCEDPTRTHWTGTSWKKCERVVQFSFSIVWQSNASITPRQRHMTEVHTAWFQYGLELFAILTST